MRSVMAVIAKCTIDLTNSLERTSELLSKSINDFNESSTKLTGKIIYLNRILTIATIVGAIATVIIGINSLLL